MYWLFILLTLVLICFSYRWYLIRKVRSLAFFEKIQILNNASEPFGFLYDYSEDMFSSAGASAAPLCPMLTDSERVYFDYGKKTWLMEFRKGQCGIACGGETGIYRADTLVSPSHRKTACFMTVPGFALPKVTFRVYDNKNTLFTCCGRQQRLTGFRPGHHAIPSCLHMPVCVTFPNEDMMRAFTDSLLELGYPRSDLSIWQHSLSFCFSKPKSADLSMTVSTKQTLMQKEISLLCRLYRFAVRPFDDTVDRLVFLSFLLPFVFRRIVTLKKYGTVQECCGKELCHGN